MQLVEAQHMATLDPEISRGGGRGRAGDEHNGADESPGSHPKCVASPVTGAARGRVLHPQLVRRRHWRSSSPSTVGMHADCAAVSSMHVNKDLPEDMSQPRERVKI